METWVKGVLMDSLLFFYIKIAFLMYIVLRLLTATITTEQKVLRPSSSHHHHNQGAEPFSHPPNLLPAPHTLRHPWHYSSVFSGASHIWNRIACQLFETRFLHSDNTWDSPKIFNMGGYTNWFSNAKPALHSWPKCHLVVVYRLVFSFKY